MPRTDAKIGRTTLDSRYVETAGDTMTGDLTIGANKLITTNLLLKEMDSNFLGVRDSIDDIHKGMIFTTLRIAKVESWNAENAIVQFQGKEGIGAMTEVARIQGGASPYFQISNSGIIKPDADSTYDLGASDPLYYANLYVDKIYLDSDSTVEAADVDNWNASRVIPLAYNWFTM